MTTWKAVERSVAKLLGGERVPVSGRQRGFSPDIQHDVFSIEVKHRKELPAWILEAMQQAVASKKDNQIPIVILHQKYSKFEKSLAILELCDVLELIKKEKL